VQDPLELVAFPAPPDRVGAELSYTAQTNFVGSFTYTWDFGDGTPPAGPSASPDVSHTFTAPGRYIVTLDVVDPASGNGDQIQFVQNVTAPATPLPPTSSSSIAYEGVADRVWVVNPDNDSVSVIDAASLTRLDEIPVCDDPRSVALAGDGRAWVACKDAAAIAVTDSPAEADFKNKSLPGIGTGSINPYRPGQKAIRISFRERDDCAIEEMKAATNLPRCFNWIDTDCLCGADPLADVPGEGKTVCYQNAGLSCLTPGDRRVGHANDIAGDRKGPEKRFLTRGISDFRHDNFVAKRRCPGSRHQRKTGNTHRVLIDFRHGPADRIGIERRDPEPGRRGQAISQTAGPDFAHNHPGKTGLKMTLQKPERRLDRGL